MNILKTNPVRVYAVAVAGLALASHYVPSIPTVLVLGLVAAVLGVGEGVRAAVTPNSRVVVDASEVPDGHHVLIYGEDEFRG